MSYSSGRGRSSGYELPPKMAHKEAYSAASESSNYQPYQNKSGHNQQNQSGKSAHSNDAVYQQNNTKSRASVQNQNKTAQEPAYQSNSASKQQNTQQKISPKDLVLNPHNPPFTFNIISRGNIPGLVFQQVYVNQ